MLVNALGDDVPEVVDEANRALAAAAPEIVTPALALGLSAGTPSVRLAAAKLLEAHASKDVKVRVWLVGRVLGGGGHIVSLRGTSGTDDARSLQHKPHNNKLKRCWSSPTRPTPTR